MQASLSLSFAILVSLLFSHPPAVAGSASPPGRCELDDKAATNLPPYGAPERHTDENAGLKSSGATYYVASVGKDEWSGRLPEPNADRTDGPVASLARARDDARADKQANSEAAASTIVLRGGSYHFSQPVIFTALDAGTRLLAYPGEMPVLTGATTLYPPKPSPNGILILPFASDPGRDVFVGDIRHSLAFRSRPTDATGWTTVASPQSGNNFAYRGADFGPGDIAIGTLVELVDRDRSYDVVTTISAVDPAKGIATVAPVAYGPIENIESFRLAGRAKWLKIPGRFAYDGPRRQLILLPAARSSVQKDGIRLPVLHSILIFRGTGHITVAGLKFIETGAGNETEHDRASIVLDQAHDMTIHGNYFHNVGQAVRLIASSGNSLTDNHISETGSTAIELQDSSDRNLLSDNELIGIGRTDRAATAIYLHGASANRIAGNLIKDVARHGIGIDNWDDQTINSGNIIEENRVWKTSRTAFDSGAIEMLGRSRKDTSSVIRFNDIRDTRPADLARNSPRESLASGIYLDDFTSGILICGNRISGAPLAAIQIHGGSDISIRDNLVLLDRPKALFVFSQAADANEEGQRFMFNTRTVSPAPAGRHTITVTFDNDAVIGNEDRDLFVSKIAIGAKPIPATDPSARYLVGDGRILPGQVAMPWNGKLEWSVPQSAFEDNADGFLAVYAWSNPAGGVGAHFTVAVDGISLGEGNAGPAADRITGNSVNRNIVYATTEGPGYFKEVQTGPPAISSNAYIDKTGKRGVPLIDSKAIVTEPGFRNSGRGDFRLNASSSLFAAGFRDLPFCLNEETSCPDKDSSASSTIPDVRRSSKLGFELARPSRAKARASGASLRAETPINP
jgi:parallel beta-helix repeat protein